MKKKIIILQHGGGQLCNQLWNFISIYAYSLEKNLYCYNYSFFEYYNFFNIPTGNKFIHFFIFLPFRALRRIFGFNFAKKIIRRVYIYYVRYVFFFQRDNITTTNDTLENNNGYYYLPPTVSREPRETCFSGWLFRNPVGIEKYRDAVIEYFTPKDIYVKNAHNLVFPERKKFKNIIGVHIRQRDYKTSKGGMLYTNQTRIRDILIEYLKFSNKPNKETCFIICSDGDIDKNTFDDLNIIKSELNLIEDILVMSYCDVIIGSDSTFGAFASYFGNIPHIVFKNDMIDWHYYTDKNKYFVNKYCLSLTDDIDRWVEAKLS